LFIAFAAQNSTKL